MITTNPKEIRKLQKAKARNFERLSTQHPNDPRAIAHNAALLLTETTKTGKTKASCLFRGNVSKVFIKGTQIV